MLNWRRRNGDFVCKLEATKRFLLRIIWKLIKAVWCSTDSRGAMQCALCRIRCFASRLAGASLAFGFGCWPPAGMRQCRLFFRPSALHDIRKPVWHFLHSLLCACRRTRRTYCCNDRTFNDRYLPSLLAAVSSQQRPVCVASSASIRTHTSVSIAGSRPEYAGSMNDCVADTLPRANCTRTTSPVKFVPNPPRFSRFKTAIIFKMRWMGT